MSRKIKNNFRTKKIRVGRDHTLAIFINLLYQGREIKIFYFLIVYVRYIYF